MSWDGRHAILQAEAKGSASFENLLTDFAGLFLPSVSNPATSDPEQFLRTSRSGMDVDSQRFHQQPHLRCQDCLFVVALNPYAM